jgi:hypothetical protein
VPGLVTEAETLETLEAKLNSMVPELLEANVSVSEVPRIWTMVTDMNSLYAEREVRFAEEVGDLPCDCLQHSQ